MALALPQFNRYNENEYIIDDKRKIIVNQKSLTPMQHYIYKRQSFVTMRPDLNDLDFFIWKEKWRLGENYLNEMRKRLNGEVRRLTMFQTLATRRK